MRIWTHPANTCNCCQLRCFVNTPHRHRPVHTRDNCCLISCKSIPLIIFWRNLRDKKPSCLQVTSAFLIDVRRWFPSWRIARKNLYWPAFYLEIFAVVKLINYAVHIGDYRVKTNKKLWKFHLNNVKASGEEFRVIIVQKMLLFLSSWDDGHKENFLIT